MPLYAPFQPAIFGETLFGIPPSPGISTAISCTPIGYDTLQVDWPTPGGLWSSQMLLRSSYGIPSSIYEGEVLLTQTQMPWTAQYVDSGLKSGLFYYYAVYCYSTQLDEWVLAGSCQGLCLTDYDFADTFISWLPDFYFDLDSTYATSAQPNGPLTRYLQMLGYEMDWIRSEIESFVTFSNVELVSGALLPALGGNYGMTYEPELGMIRSRVLVQNAVYLYKNRGTATGIESAASAYTGYGCVVTIGINLEIQLDDAAFDDSTGHWMPGNALSTIQVQDLLAFTLSPQHQLYDPVPAFASSYSGYLPQDNNTNVALISAGVSNIGIQWNQLTGPVNPPVRSGAAMAYDTAATAAYMFGGASTQGVLNDLWALTGSVWSNITPTSAAAPPPRSGHTMSYDSVKGQVVMFGGINGSTALSDTWIWTSGAGWVQANPQAAPSARSYHAQAYDTYTNCTLIYGGISTNGTVLNDTWEWNGSTWRQVNPSASPPALWGASMVYSANQDCVLLFGGQTTGAGNYQDKTWKWNGSDWLIFNEGPDGGSVGPGARQGAMFAYDATSGDCILFGGFNGSTYYNDTWQLAGSTWTQLSPSTTPGKRAYAAFSADPATGSGDRLTMFGGYNGTSVLTDTWIWTGSTWTAESPSTVPPLRTSSAACYTGTGVLMFAGNAGGTLVYNDTWYWNGSNWTLEGLSVSPPGRAEHNMAYDSNTSTVVMFGGTTSDTYNYGTGLLNDTWTWNGSSWTNANPATSPPGRINFAMCYDATTSTVIIFGGQGANNTILDDMWSWNGTTWSQLTPATLPSARYNTAMASDPNAAPSQQVVLFGGQTSPTNFLADTWTWNGTTWSLQSPATSPSARASHGMCYDTAYNSPFVFGGHGPEINGSAYYNDVWEWYEGVNWVLLTPGSTANPGPRQGACFIYDTSLTAAVMFGGYNFGAFFADTWFLTQGQAISSTLSLTNCTPANAPYLGIPVVGGYAALNQATPQPAGGYYCVSAYFRNYLDTAEPFYMQIDWYGLNGVYISSTAGTPVTEYLGWTRAYVVGTPPAGALTFGRTVVSSASFTNTIHFMDAVQVEYSPNSTFPSGPSAWEPPRDIKVNLLPVRQNLIVDPQGLGGGVGWTHTSATLAESTSGAIPWPAGTTGGYIITSTSVGTMTFYCTLLVNPDVSYSGSVYVMAAATGRNGILTITYNTVGGSIINSVSVPFTDTTAGFVRVSNTNQAAPPNAYSATYTVQISGLLNTGESHYIAAPLFEPLSYLAPYFDGNFNPSTDYFFEGTPNQSISDYYPLLEGKVSRLVEILPDYVPIGSTFSIITGAQALANANLAD